MSLSTYTLASAAVWAGMRPTATLSMSGVILLKDGTVYDALARNTAGNESRGLFQDRLLAAIKQMSTIEGGTEEP